MQYRPNEIQTIQATHYKNNFIIRLNKNLAENTQDHLVLLLVFTCEISCGEERYAL